MGARAELKRAWTIFGKESNRAEALDRKKNNQNKNRSSKKRLEEFDRDYPTLLISLSAGVKTGLDPLVALSRSADLFQEGSVMREELQAFNEALEKGESEDRAITRFGSTINHPDIRLFHLAFRLARKEGSSLAICLQRLARVTRQRQSFRRKVRSAVAMQKLSAFGIAGCALLIGAVQVLGSQQALRTALSVPLGQVMMSVSIVLLTTGLIWMFRMTRFRV